MKRRKPTSGTHYAAENPALDSEASDSLRKDVASLPWDGPTLLSQPLTRIQFSEDSGYDLVIEVAPLREDDRKEALETLGGVVGERAAKSLLALEPRLLAWLDEHRDHPAQFVSDPLTCLERLGLEQDDDLSELSRLRSAQLRALDPSSVEEVHSITVRLHTDEEKKER
jgi:hypothetical protein